MKRIWKPWTLEIVGIESHMVTQVTFYRFWRASTAHAQACRMNGLRSPAELDMTYWRAGRLR